MSLLLNKYKKNAKNLVRLFARYPKESGVHPGVFKSIRYKKHGDEDSIDGVLAIQSVADKFYFLLFGAIRENLRLRLHGSAELVVVRSINGAVGTGWLAEIKRGQLISWLWTNPWIRAYGPIIDNVAYRCASWTNPFKDLADWFRSKALWHQLQVQGEAYSLKIDGIEVVDLVIDSFLRFKPAPVFDVSDPFVRRLVWQVLRDVRQAHAYFGRARPRLYLTSYTTYLEHGIPARVALRYGVDVWTFGNLNGFGKQLTNQDSFHTQDFSTYRKKFEQLDRQQERLEESRLQLETRLSGGIDAATSYMRASAYGQVDMELPAGLNGAVIVFLHDFYDSPHVYPDLVFHDFWRWICFTIEVLKKTGVAFFLKQHPNQITMGDAAIEGLKRKYPSLKWLPSGVSNVQLANAGIACGVTVYGTVAHELAYLGIPSIGCARHPHHTFDFCRTAQTTLEYENLLKSPRVLPVPKEEMQRQSLAFYYMHNLHGSDSEVELRKAFVAFWRACNVGAASENEVVKSFQDLIRLPAFSKFVEALVNTKNTNGDRCK